ncbi:MAG: alpha/beta hydrolase family protein [Planctomycetaceae bacterium]
MRRVCVWAGFVVTAIVAIAGPRRAVGADDAPQGADRHGVATFDLEKLFRVPEVFPADGFQVGPEGDGRIRPMFFAGPEHRGRPTRVFAWYGAPAVAAGTKLPAMVLVHGGGGTAFERWVKVWNDRGYAAIAMDLCGCVPRGTYGNWERHADGGPPGWDAAFGQLEEPLQDQWPHQAVSAIVLAHSLVRSFPEVDAGRVGVTGISWGGYLTCLTAGVDPRFRLAVPVYGCGYLADDSAWLARFAEMGPDKAGRWTAWWDPASWLPRAEMPMLWVNGTNDFAYPPGSWQRSYRLPKGPRTLCLRVRMPHGHGPAGENPEEIRAFADAILRDPASPPAAGLPTVTGQGTLGDRTWLSWRGGRPIRTAELCFTLADGPWQDRLWETAPATIEAGADDGAGGGARASAVVPAGATAWYLNLVDEAGLVVSGEHVVR